MKKTTLYNHHIEKDAKIVSFAGFAMPIQYSGIIDEHNTVRNSVGIFDLSHMGEFEISGKGAEVFLQKMTINDVANLEIGQAQYTAMCTNEGGIIDDCVLYRNEVFYLIVVNASNIEKDFLWLNKHLEENVSLIDASDDTTLIAVQGPESKELLKKVLDDGSVIDSLKFYHQGTITFNGKQVLCSRTGYTGELGYEIYWKGEGASNLWDALLVAGKEFDAKPIGLGARDTLRLEMKYCLYGNDIDESTNPIEAGLSRITKLDKGSFVGRKALDKVKENGVSRRLVAFKMSEKGIPRKDYIVFSNNIKIGIVTSGTLSPSLKSGIGMAYVNIPFVKVGTEMQIEIRGKLLQAKIIKPPFWMKGSLMVN